MALWAIMDGEKIVRSKNFGNSPRVYSSEGRAKSILKQFQENPNDYPNAKNYRLVKFVETYYSEQPEPI